MASIADLARQRINILQVTPGDKILDAIIEYQYKPQDAPHTWHKVAITVNDGESLYDKALDVVLQAKAELER